MKLLRYIFDDWLSRSAGIVLALILFLTVFSIYSDLPNEHPLLGVLMFAMVPLLFIVGGIIFILAILKYV